MKKLQIAFDEFTLEESLALCEKVRDSIDIIEIGTPFIIEEGMHAVRAFREKFPEKEILADAKIMDAGELEAESCFKAGADYVTVLGVTDIRTIAGCVEAAKKYNKKIVVDMICVEDIDKRVQEIEAVGITDIAVHTGVDLQAAGRTPLEDLKQMKKSAKQSLISVAGGIKENTVDEYIKEGADVLIVGGGISHAEDPAEAAMKIAKKVHA